MRFRVILAGLLMMASATTAMAAGPYVTASGGVSMFHDSDLSEPGLSGTAEYKTGYGFNIGAGYNFDPVRVEFEFGYKNAEVDTLTLFGISASVSDTNLTTMSFMANAYYDFKNSSPFTPYIGAGIGAIYGEISGGGASGDDTVFGYQAIVGGAYNVNKNFAIDLSYRFQGAASDFSLGGTDTSYMSSNIVAGLRYQF